MTIWTALILGLLIGWVVEWVIDWIYWRQQAQNSTAELENLRAQLGRLRADLTIGTGSLAKIKAELTTLQADNERLHSELDAANGSLGQYKAELGTMNTSLSAAQADNDRLQTELHALHAERVRTQPRLDTPDTRTPYATQLLSIDPTLAGVHLGDADVQEHNDEFENLRAELAGANGEIARLRTQLESHQRSFAVGERRRDPLIDINGIGPVYEQRLFDAGISSFAELAAQSPERLRALVGAKSWQEIDTEAWIVEARQFIADGHGRSAQ